MIRTLFYFLVSIAFCCYSSQAQSDQKTAQTSPEKVPTLKVSTRLVLVDVIVTDNKGTAVPDLNAEDFTLLEDSKEQKIRVFNFVDARQPEAPQPPAPPLPANRFTNVPRVKPHGAMTIILLDGINTRPKNQSYAREQMIKLLPKLPSGQPVAVFAMGLGLRLLQDFTSDPALLKTAIEKKSGAGNPAADPNDTLGHAMGASMEQMPQLIRERVLAFERESVANQLDQRVELTLSQLRALARAMAGIPGRKNLIWVSENFPEYLYPVTAETQHAFSGPGSIDSASRNYLDEVERTSDLLANAQLAVYPVDTRGLSNDDPYAQLLNTDSNGNSLGRSAMGRVGGAQGSQMGTEMSIASEASTSAHTTMNQVAELTGGKAFYNVNDLSNAVRQGIQDGSTYYTLGYYPENKDWNGKFRKIAVKSNHAGVKLRFRQGYFAVDPHASAHMNEKARAQELGDAMSLEFPASTALSFQAAVVTPSAANKNTIFNFAIDPHQVAFDAGADGKQHAKLECAVRAYTLDGKEVQTRGNSLEAALPPEQYQLVMQKFFPCSQALELPSGKYVFRLAVRDNTTGLVGTANAFFEIPGPASSAGSGAGAKN